MYVFFGLGNSVGWLANKSNFWLASAFGLFCFNQSDLLLSFCFEYFLSPNKIALSRTPCLVSVWCRYSVIRGISYVAGVFSTHIPFRVLLWEPFHVPFHFVSAFIYCSDLGIQYYLVWYFTAVFTIDTQFLVSSGGPLHVLPFRVFVFGIFNFFVVCASGVLFVSVH